MNPRETMATGGGQNDDATVSLEGTTDKQPPPPKSKKIYIPIRIQTNALNNDDIAINATYISIEDLSSRTKKKETKKGKNIEIRYLESIRSFKDKIKSSYSCNQQHCPMIKERLDQHQQEHHSCAESGSRHDRQSQTNIPSAIAVASKPSIHRVLSTEPGGVTRSVAISPAASILKRNSRFTESHSIQTPPKFVDFTHTAQGSRSFETNLFRSDEQTQFSHDTFKTVHVQNETTTTSKNSFVRDDLHEEILKWFEDIPIYPNITASLKNLRRNMVNEFIDKLFELSNDSDSKDYERKVKFEIENFLNALPMWYPGAKRDQDLLKEGIKNNLLKKINGLRTKTNNETQVATLVDDTVNTDDDVVNGSSLHRLGCDDKEKMVESEVLDWLMQIKFKESDEIGRTVNIIDATDIFTKRLMPLLDKPSGTKNYKLILKGLIVDTLNDLPNVLHFPKNKKIYLNRIAEDLANRLLLVQSKCKSFSSCKFPRERSMYRLTVCSKSSLKQSILEGLSNCLKGVTVGQQNEIKEEITDIIIDCIESISGKKDDDEMSNILRNSLEISEAQASEVTIENVRDMLTEDIIKNADCNRNLEQSCHSGTMSVFTSEHEISGPSKYPVTSTPKKKAEVSKLNAEEISYMSKVSCLIRAWMEVLPKKFDAPDEKEFKDTIIQDLAGDIMDQVKLEQLAPQSGYDRDKYMNFFIFKWLLKFNIYEDEEVLAATPEVEQLVKKLQEIPVPVLTKPQHGSRQAMSNIKHMEGDLAWKEYFVPKGIDVLEDEISIFMGELPSDMYKTVDKDKQNKMVHELADAVKKCLNNKKPDRELTDEVSKWLKKMVKSPNQDIEKLAENLKERIVKLPQDATLSGKVQKKIQQRNEVIVENANPCNKCGGANDSKNGTTVAPDTDRTLMEFIGKFMERNYNVVDSMARGAFGELLKTEFRKLSPPTRKEVYDNFSKSQQHDEFSPERLGKELQYIKDISDWLRNIPIEGSYNTPNNKKRIEFVNDLAKNVYDVEESRRKSPSAMDYNMYLASIISQSINELPILPEHTGNVMLMIDELVGKIAASRTPMPCCTNANKTAASINSTGIQEQNISDFIDHYIRNNAGDIADDQVKLDAWSARLLKEVKKLARDTADPSTLCKTQVYNKLITIPIPEDESVRLFGLELDYAKEISDWINNLPLLPITSQESSDLRVKMISELAEKFAERERNKIVNPSDPPPDSDMDEFITRWIQQLPLDRNKEVVYPIVIQQLQKRIERVNKGPEESIQPSNESTSSPKKSKSKTKNKSKSSKSCRPSCCSSGGKAGRSGQIIVEAIENWANKLPVRAENKDAERTMKDDIARKLYQKAGELSVDPQIMNDDLLYQELFTDEVNAQLNNLQSPDIQKKKESLKNDLVDKVMEAKSVIKECTAGDNYKHQLENTIEASIPSPIYNRQFHDPGFEIYKNHLADMFILENFDHGNDAVKVKYENLIKKEIDKYFQDALKRNAVPLTKEQIYSELYSALYKVPTPNENSTSAEVEEVITRCEIDDWFGTLKLREASGVGELLEWDKILSMLAKRLREIEKNEQKPDEKMHKEITKWVVKFPLLPGQEGDIDKLADDLQNRLKTSKEERKCVPAPPLNGKDSKKGKVQKKASKSKGILGTSQVAGPSSASQPWVSPTAAPVCCQGSPIPRKKPADIILEIVEYWCESLPLYAGTPQDQQTNKIIREDLLTKIIIKICELNSNPQTFSDDLLYNYLLDQELEVLMSKVPICCDFKPTKDSKKTELVAAIDAVKPLMREERARHEYVQELKSTVNTILEEPLNTTADVIKMFNELRDDIVDNFVQFHYNRDDDIGKQIYKAKIRDAVTKYLVDINEKPEGPPVDPLIRQNQLLCELSKVSIPSERAVKDEVEEVRMKNEVKQFFDELAFPDEDEEKMTLRNNMKQSLAKRLNEIEKTGHNCANDAKMKKEISRCLKKIEKEVDPKKIEAFVERLKMNEGARKAPPAGKDTCYCSKDNQSNTGPCQCGKNPNQIAAAPNPAISQNIPIANQLHVPEFGGTGQGSIRNDGTIQSLGVTPVEYQGFGGGVVLTSSRQGASNNPKITLPKAKTPTSTEQPTGDREDMPTNQGEREARAEANRERKRRKTGSDDEEDCKCIYGRIRKKMRGRPRCVLRRPEFCNECDDFEPMWMPMPAYRFPPSYFYY
ncbi:uncharacterized protein LOC114352839 [Ostrinia furnacalis]|uniref:uncharacterized protein LOC114352839 n=1 Tax=Ostrinia furnacalis TaxID=93504 RepID=UPI00103B59E0|nr:uncharacterized protein LOC114352839 [Ostrinia furnacalis]